MTAIIGAITFLLISDRTVPAASPEVNQSSEVPPDDPKASGRRGDACRDWPDGRSRAAAAP
jgi:hypothetical protein